MKLAFEAFTALAASCSVGDVPSELVAAVVGVESAYYVYAMSGSYEQSDYSRLPKTNEEIGTTVLAASESVRKGINVSLGLMQVNSYHIDRMKYDVATVFNPCYNMAMGTSLLNESLGRTCGCTYSKQCIIETLREYNTGRTKKSKAGDLYASKVIAKLKSSDQFFSTLPRTRKTQRCSQSS